MPRGRDTDWADLLRAANRGDAGAYSRFLRDVAPVIRGIARARSGELGESAVEDVVQDVLLTVHAKRHTWRDTERVEPWLHAIARHKVIDAFRLRGRRIDVPIEDFAEVLPAPDAPDPTELSDMLRVIARLDDRSAGVAAGIVRSIGLEGASVRETGARFGMTETAAWVSLHRSMKKLAGLRGG